MRSYEAARSLFSFLGFIAWSVIIVGGLVAFIGASGGSRYGGAGAALVAMVPGISIAISGFILLAFVQIGRAGVDTAEYTQQMLKISRDQLEVSRQSLNQGASFAKSFADSAAKPQPSLQHVTPVASAPETAPVDTKAQTLPAEPPIQRRIEHKGYVIENKKSHAQIGTKFFLNVADAKSFIDDIDKARSPLTATRSAQE